MGGLDTLVVVGLLTMLGGAAWLLVSPAGSPPEIDGLRVRRAAVVVVLGLVLVVVGIWLYVRQVDTELTGSGSAGWTSSADSR